MKTHPHWSIVGVVLAVAGACADDRGDPFGAAELPNDAGNSDRTAAPPAPAADAPLRPSHPDGSADGDPAAAEPVDAAAEPVDAAAEPMDAAAGASWPSGPVPLPWRTHWIGEPPAARTPPPDAVDRGDSPEPAGDREPDASLDAAEPEDAGSIDRAGNSADGALAEVATAVGNDDQAPEMWWAQAHTTGQSFGLRAAGRGVEPSAPDDQFLFVHRTVPGDTTLLARVAVLAGCPRGRITFGLMVRASLMAGAPYVMAAVSSTPGATLQTRRYEGQLANVPRIDNGVNLPLWLRVTRRGTVASAGYSRDGQVWRETELELALPLEAQIGLVASSHAPSQPCDGLFEGVSFYPSASGPPH